MAGTTGAAGTGVAGDDGRGRHRRQVAAARRASGPAAAADRRQRDGRERSPARAAAADHPRAASARLGRRRQRRRSAPPADPAAAARGREPLGRHLDRRAAADRDRQQPAGVADQQHAAPGRARLARRQSDSRPLLERVRQRPGGHQPAHVAVCRVNPVDSTIDTATDKALAFSGTAAVTIAQGQAVWSDRSTSPSPRSAT